MALSCAAAASGQRLWVADAASPPASRGHDLRVLKARLGTFTE
jgi:hypothetical protein